MRRAQILLLLLSTSFGLGGCSLVVDFDRSLLLDGGADAGDDASVEAGIGGSSGAGGVGGSSGAGGVGGSSEAGGAGGEPASGTS